MNIFLKLWLKIQNIHYDIDQEAGRIYFYLGNDKKDYFYCLLLDYLPIIKIRYLIKRIKFLKEWSRQDSSLIKE